MEGTVPPLVEEQINIRLGIVPTLVEEQKGIYLIALRLDSCMHDKKKKKTNTSWRYSSAL